MRVTSLGHASLYVETEDQRILIDPVFSENLVNGAIHFNPARRVDAKHFDPTVIVITSSHFAHFDPQTVKQFQKDVALLVPDDVQLRRELEALGFLRVSVVGPWQDIELGRTRLVGTPAFRQPKLGIAVFNGGSFWNMADTETIRACGEGLNRRYGRIDVVAAKYQPSEQIASDVAFGRGTHFDKSTVIKWLESACAASPALIFPSASGLRFGGSLDWLNRFVFPFSGEEIVELLRRRSGTSRAEVVNPGDVVEISADGPPVRIPQASPLVTMVSSSPDLWEPIDAAHLAGLDDVSERSELEERLDSFLAGRLIPWLQNESLNQVIWQLVVELGGSCRIERFIDHNTDLLKAVPGRHQFANRFTHLSGRILLDIFRHETSADVLSLAGQMRNYDKAIGVVDGRLCQLDITTDPLTYFLLHFGLDGDSSRSKPVDSRGFDLFTRYVEPPAVLEKKVLLSILATQEASRLGVSITEAESKSICDGFRSMFGLEDDADLAGWLDEVGLDMERFLCTMQEFAAVSSVQAHWSHEIQSRMATYAKIASIRNRER